MDCFSCAIRKMNLLCNPITRDYIELPTLQDQDLLNSNRNVEVDTLAIGVSKIIGQYKVVMILHDICTLISEYEYESYVYTIGTRSWRRVAGPDTRRLPLKYGSWVNWAFLNGHLHWPVTDSKPDSERLHLSCLDLETELYSTFSFPPKRYGTELCVLEDCLCLCSSNYDRIDFWLMKKYGDDKSWTKQLSIPTVDTFSFYGCLNKVFKEGDMLIAWRARLFFYNNKDNTMQKFHMFEGCDDMDMILFNPSFHSLKNFEMENVTPF